MLPKDDHFSKLLITEAHRRLLHAGVRDTLVQLRERFWIVRARQMIKKEIKKCIACQRLNARPMSEVTAPLPADRVTEAEAFEVVGVDFAGPVWVTARKTKRKAYLTLFTCAVTRAVHLEMVPDMTAETFLRALRRFVSRRGVPRVIYSDNALAFKRSKKDLSELWNVLRDEEVRNYFANSRIQWKFIAERAPWWGGFYERLIRSVKNSLKKVIGRRVLTEEELVTLLTEVEAIINSRPLTYAYSEAQEPQPLSPSHFTTGKRLTSLPKPSDSDLQNGDAESLRRLWKLREDFLKEFWQRWSKEYLTELRSLYKTRRSNRHLKVGDLVILHESQQPRQLWKMGVVKTLFSGRDGRVRVCEIRLPAGAVVKRPIQLVYGLESG